MPSGTLCVLRGRYGDGTTRSVEDGVTTQSMGTRYGDRAVEFREESHQFGPTRMVPSSHDERSVHALELARLGAVIPGELAQRLAIRRRTHHIQQRPDSQV